MLFVRGVPDLGQRLLRPRVRGARESPEDVGDLVEPAALFPRGREDLAQRTPEPERTVSDREFGAAAKLDNPHE